MNKSLKSKDNQRAQDWAKLLEKAVSVPGLILEAYSAFHSYSLGNQIAAASQCRLRGLPIGPINTYAGWKAMNRQVRKGEKAIVLCMPIGNYAPKCAVESDIDDENGTQAAQGGRASYSRTIFDWKPNWFVLAQTEGDELAFEAPTLPTWDKATALTSLDILEVPFLHPDGNAQGLATSRSVAISPLAALPHKTLFHELAHVVLGHTQQQECSDAKQLTKSLIEAEAEATAYLLCSTLSLKGTQYARGYIQSWLRGEVIPESSARRILAAADKILKAGQESDKKHGVTPS